MTIEDEQKHFSMTPETAFQLALRLLPSIIVAVLAFVAAADTKTRERWADLLYQAGTLRPEQRDDPKVQRGVRLPFFLVALILLLWPVSYYRHATRVIEVSPNAYAKPASNFNAYGKPGAPGPNAPTAPGAPNAPAPAAPAPISPPAR